MLRCIPSLLFSTVALFVFAAPVPAVEQSKDQQVSINEVAKSFAKVSQAQGREISRCMKAAARAHCPSWREATAAFT
jgi:hypothetical protein